MVNRSPHPGGNRQALIESSLRLFAEHGYDAVGTQRLAEEAGVTKPTLYHYFGSKEGLLEAVVETEIQELRDELSATTRYEGDVYKSLTAVAWTYFEFSQRKPAFYRMLLAQWFAPRRSTAVRIVSRELENQQALLERFFEEAASDHGNMRGRHKRYAATYLGMINTYIGLAQRSYATIGDSLVHDAVHQFMHGIFS